MSEPSEILKNELKKASEEYRDEIREGIKAFGEAMGKTGKNALIISGSLLVGYLLYRGLTRTETPKVKKVKKNRQQDTDNEAQEATEEWVVENIPQTRMPRMIDRVADSLIENATVLLLQIAKEKLMEFLEEQARKKENDTE